MVEGGGGECESIYIMHKKNFKKSKTLYEFYLKYLNDYTYVLIRVIRIHIHLLEI